MAVIPNPKVREDLPMVEERVQYKKSELDSRDLNAEVRFVFRRDYSTVHFVTDILKMPASHLAKSRSFAWRVLLSYVLLDSLAERNGREHVLL
jgi:hypothetical protein